VTSHTTDMQPLLYDRDCPQANLILRGRVQDSHHPTGGYLTSYLIIGASLQKVNAESKSLLACHLVAGCQQKVGFAHATSLVGSGERLDTDWGIGQPACCALCREPFSREQWPCSTLLMTTRKFAIC
jgi:hypothetical protein